MKNLIFILFLIPSIIYSQEIKSDSNEYFTLTDTNLIKYKLPLKFEKPDKWKDNILKEETFKGDYSSDLWLDGVLWSIDSVSCFVNLRNAKSWCIKNYDIAFPYLILRLTVKKKVGLKCIFDLIIDCRLSSGDLNDYGHGGVIQEDIFTIAGRASWILNEITGEDFAVIRCDMSKKESESYKNKWIEYINNLK
jgi:hypothetical protein